MLPALAATPTTLPCFKEPLFLPLGCHEWQKARAIAAYPDPLPVVDGLLAATARVLGLTLVTRNIADVERTGIELFDPFAR